MRLRQWTLFSVIFLLILSFFAWSAYRQSRRKSAMEKVETEKRHVLPQLKMTTYNYGDEVKKYADECGLPREYFLALIVLECSGRKPSGERFEPHVYTKLKRLRSGEISRFENLRTRHVKNSSDAALRNLATSWGPFQLMGYKCISMGVNIADIRGANAVDHGVRWINENYGGKLKERSFKDAFHMHNTGQKFPVFGKPFTHDPLYVTKGMRYMDYFGKTQLERAE